MRRRPTAPAALLHLLLGLLLLAGRGAIAQPAEAITTIRFARGAYGAEVAGAVERGGRALYIVEAAGGQRLTVSVAAPEDNAAVQIWLPGAVLPPEPGAPITGTTLEGAGEGADTRSWAGPLPASGAYLLVVGAIRGGAAYRLRLTIH